MIRACVAGYLILDDTAASRRRLTAAEVEPCRRIGPALHEEVCQSVGLLAMPVAERCTLPTCDLPLLRIGFIEGRPVNTFPVIVRTHGRYCSARCAEIAEVRGALARLALPRSDRLTLDAASVAEQESAA